jgi:hypothetical protein
MRARDHDHDIFFHSAEILGRAQSQGRQTGTKITFWKAGSSKAVIRRGVIDGQRTYIIAQGAGERSCRGEERVRAVAGGCNKSTRLE